LDAASSSKGGVMMVRSWGGEGVGGGAAMDASGARCVADASGVGWASYRVSIGAGRGVRGERRINIGSVVLLCLEVF
jgi:hypothetical protein